MLKVTVHTSSKEYSLALESRIDLRWRIRLDCFLVQTSVWVSKRQVCYENTLGYLIRNYLAREIVISNELTNQNNQTNLLVQIYLLCTSYHSPTTLDGWRRKQNQQVEENIGATTTKLITDKHDRWVPFAKLTQIK